MIVLVVAGTVVILLLLIATNTVAQVVTGGAMQEAGPLDQSQASSAVQSIAQAIAQAEGFYISGSLAQRNNNPGNLTVPAAAAGQNPLSAYPTAQDGWDALYGEVNLILSGDSHIYTADMPISVIAQHWTTDVPPGAQANWASNVARALGMTPDQSFNDYLSVVA